MLQNKFCQSNPHFRSHKYLLAIVNCLNSTFWSVIAFKINHPVKYIFYSQYISFDVYITVIDEIFPEIYAEQFQRLTENGLFLARFRSYMVNDMTDFSHLRTWPQFWYYLSGEKKDFWNWFRFTRVMQRKDGRTLIFFADSASLGID